MRLLPIFAALLLFASACGQSAEKKLAQQEKDAIESVRPGTIPTASGGWTMTATIDGKPRSAVSMMPPDAAGRIIGYYKNGYIGLPYPSNLEVGHKSVFGEGNAVDYSPADDPNFWGGRSGEMEITKVGNGWVEGKFHFTARLKSPDKKAEVSDGFFRIKSKQAL